MSICKLEMYKRLWHYIKAVLMINLLHRANNKVGYHYLSMCMSASIVPFLFLVKQIIDIGGPIIINSNLWTQLLCCALVFGVPYMALIITQPIVKSGGVP